MHQHLPEEVHASCEGDDISKTNYTLAPEELARNHRIGCELPFPDHPSDNKRNSKDERAKDVRTTPCMGVATRVKGDETIQGQDGTAKISCKLTKESIP